MPDYIRHSEQMRGNAEQIDASRAIDERLRPEPPVRREESLRYPHLACSGKASIMPDSARRL
jgi:hypothetical protein